MPELPEVETIRVGLRRLIIGKTIKSVENNNPKSFPNSPSDVDSFLLSAKVTDVRRRAKVLMIDLDSNYTLVIHLKMTGQLVYIEKEGPAPPLVPEINSETSLHPLKLEHSSRREEGVEDDKKPYSNSEPISSKSESVATMQSRRRSPSFRGRGEDRELTSLSSGGVSPSLRFGAGHPNDSLVGQLPDKSTRVTFTFDDSSYLYFNDQRKFGWVKLYPTPEVPNIDFMRRVGPEPLEDGIDAQIFINRVRRRNGTTIKAAILDQSVIAGVGNIYADESLWASRIHPERRVRNVDDSELASLLSEIQAVLRLSIEKGGSTDRNYIDAEGKRGSYLEFANVFRRGGQPCQRCGAAIEKIRVAGRGTHICPVCQPN